MRRQSVHLATQDAAGLQHPTRLAQVIEYHLAAGDVLEDGVGVDEVERAVGTPAQVGAAVHVGVSVGHLLQSRTGEVDHFSGDVDAVDLAEALAHGQHDAAGAAADF